MSSGTFFSRLSGLSRFLLPGRRGSPAADIQVVVYGKRECCLCDEVKATLLAVRREIPFRLEEVDIESAPELYETYKERIPLVLVNGLVAFKFHVDARQLRRRLRREQP